MARHPSFGANFREYFPSSRALFSLAWLLALTSPGWPVEALPVREIAPGVFVHQGRYEIFTPRNSGDTSNAGFVIGRDGVAVIDTGGSPRVGAGLLAAIRERTKLPIRYVINTHMHPDHVFGNTAFTGENPQFVGHAKLPRALAARADRYLAINRELLGEAFEGTRILPPQTLVKDRLELDLGDRKLRVEAHPTAHTDNDLIVTDAKTGTVFLGDLLFSGHVPTLDGSLRGWLSLIDQLERHAPARVVPGHGPHAMQLPAALGDEKRYWSTVAGDVRKLIAEGQTLSEATKTAGQSERGKWAMFDQYHVRNVTAAFAELEWE